MGFYKINLYTFSKQVVDNNVNCKGRDSDNSSSLYVFFNSSRNLSSSFSTSSPSLLEATTSGLALGKMVTEFLYFPRLTNKKKYYFASMVANREINKHKLRLSFSPLFYVSFIHPHMATLFLLSFRFESIMKAYLLHSAHFIIWNNLDRLKSFYLC